MFTENVKICVNSVRIVNSLRPPRRCRLPGCHRQLSGRELSESVKFCLAGFHQFQVAFGRRLEHASQMCGRGRRHRLEGPVGSALDSQAAENAVVLQPFAKERSAAEWLAIPTNVELDPSILEQFRSFNGLRARVFRTLRRLRNSFRR